MAEYPKALLTNLGLDLLAQAQTGEELIFTKVHLGDGELTGENIEELTSLLSDKMQVGLQSIKQTDTGKVRIRFVFSSEDVVSNFFVREIGLYAKIGEEGEEQLYAYTNAGNLADYLSKDNVGDETMIDIDVIIGNAANVTAVVSSGIYATVKDLEDHNNDPNAHDGLLGKGGFAIGQTTIHLGITPPPGFLELAGSEVGRDTYPNLWSWVQTQTGLLISDEDWQQEKTDNGECGFYSTGNGINTFRLPLIDSFARAKGNSNRNVGDFQGDTIRNIIGDTGLESNPNSVEASGALGKSEDAKLAVVYASTNTVKTIDFDASRVVPTSEENRPKSVTFLYCVKAFDAEINEGLIDITQLANDVASLTNKFEFICIYPNNGTEESPADIVRASRYIVDNPFPGYHIQCLPQLFWQNIWTDPCWFSAYTSTRNSSGVRANQTVPDDKIVIQTGRNALIAASLDSGNAFDILYSNESIIPAQLPCRILVLKLGKIT